MRFSLHIIVTFFTCLLLQSVLPWWSLAIGCLAVGYGFSQRSVKSFTAGFIGVGVLWLAMALLIDLNTNSILSERVAQLFPTKTVPLLYVVTILVGGLVGGMASLAGSLLKGGTK